MASAELKWALDRIASDRAKAGVSAERYDVAAARASNAPTELPMPAGTTIEYLLLDQLPCYWVAAPDADPDIRMVYYHGGGYFAGGFHSHRTLVGWLSKLAGAVVLFPEYRLAPEHRFPSAVDDANAALSYVRSRGPSSRARPARSIFIGGDSAGAGLAIAAMLSARGAGESLPAAAFLLCGMLDLDERTSKFLQMTQRTRDMVRQYVVWLEDLTNPLASPMIADLRGLPPLLIQTGTDDYARDDSIRFAERAKAADVRVELAVWPEMIHVWQRFAPKLPEANQALEQIAAFCRAQMGTIRGVA